MLSIVVLLLLVLSCPLYLAQTVPQSEIDALESFYNALDGPNWTWDDWAGKKEWNFTNPTPCSWQGITCGTDAQYNWHVQYIQLVDFNLRGQIPDAIANLTELKSFSANYNSITGSFPTIFGSIPTLNTLDLAGNQLHGEVPVSVLLGLPAFYDLDIGSNFFSGTISDDWSKMPLLTDLRLDSNNFYGTFPVSLTLCPKLRGFTAAYNNLTGSIPPEVANFASMEDFGLSWNHFNGTLPPSFGQMSGVDLSNNSLTGTIPASIFANNPHIFSLNLGDNRLNGTLPDTIGNTSINTLVISFTNISGSIPDSIVNSRYWQELDLRHNQLTGTVPDLWTKGVNGFGLTTLSLQYNKLRGQLPASLNNTYVYSFDAFENEFSGTLPPEWGDLNLWYLNLGYNRIEGTLPDTWGHIGMINMNINNNRLVGTIPQSFFQSDDLYTMELNSNRLWGHLPSFENATRLYLLNVSDNLLSGSLPDSFGLLTGMKQLSLQNNRFSGSLPAALNKFTQLLTLFLSNNRFSGTVPPLNKMKALDSLFLQNNRLTGSLDGVFDASTQTLLSAVDLSENQFSGALPEEAFRLPKLSIFAAVTNCFTGSIPAEALCYESSGLLQTLSLDGLQSASSCQAKFFPGNSFGWDSYGIRREIPGGIPECLFRLSNLSTLHLSGNSLTGSLPAGLDALSPSLRDLSLSHNRLTGSIPAAFQRHNWTSVDLSYNRLSGHLLEWQQQQQQQLSDVTTIPASTSVNVEVNRLSGHIPEVFQQAVSVSLLDGNLFSCSLGQNDLPQHDPFRDKYECGSNSFDLSVYVWLSLFAGSAVLVSLLVWLYSMDAYAAAKGFNRWVKMTRALRRGVVRWWRVFGPSKQPQQQQLQQQKQQQWREVYLLGNLLRRVRHCTVLVTGLCVLLLLPSYAVLTQFFHSYSQEYAYVVSAAYLTGSTAGVLLLVLFLLVGNASCWLHYQYFSEKQLLVLSRSSSPSGSERLADFVSNNSRGWSCGVVAAWCAAVLFDFAVVLAVNIGYVLISVNYSPVIVRLSQVFVVLFKLAWNNGVVMWLTRSLRDEQSKDIRVATLMILFNNLAAPAVATSLVSANCFKYVFVTPEPVTTTYSYLRCDHQSGKDIITHCYSNNVVDVHSSVTFDPPFLYSYQCSSTILSTYSSIYVIMFIVSGFVSPLLQWLAYSLYTKASADSALRSAVSLLVPLLWKTEADSGRVISVSNHPQQGEPSSMNIARGGSPSRDSAAYGRSHSQSLNNEKQRHQQHQQQTPQHQQQQLSGVMAVLARLTGSRSSAGFHYFDCDLFLLRMINMLSIIVTFGVVFPPIAGVGCLTLLLFLSFTQLLVGRFVTRTDDDNSRSRQGSEDSDSVNHNHHRSNSSGTGSRSVSGTASESAARLSRLNEDCRQCDLMFISSVWIVVPFACVFYSLFVFDTLGDEVGWRRALPPAVCVVAVPALLYAGSRLMVSFNSSSSTSKNSSSSGQLDGITAAASTAATASPLSSVVVNYSVIHEVDDENDEVDLDVIDDDRDSKSERLL